MPRKYTKKSDYWTKFDASQSQGANPNGVGNLAEQIAEMPTINYEELSLAECRSGGMSDYRRLEGPSTQGIFAQTSFPNISSGVLPYCNKNNSINVTEAVELCQRAYANVSVFRSTIDIMTEFSNSKLHLRGGSASSRKFFYDWFQKIGLYDTKEQFFREYYRSGNVFLYSITGKFKETDFIRLAGVKNKIPLKYLILNPTTVSSQGGIGYDFQYLKVMSQFEIEKYRNPKTAEDLAVYNSFPENVKKQLKTYAGVHSEIYMVLEPEKLHHIFYKKQGYEPFAIPMGFPVLNDIEWKLQLKKMDMALTRTVENIILLITMGAKKDDGGINYKNIKAMQELFKNQMAGRVIISDYTTKAEFIVPDLKEILGKEKYEVVNQDIADGLQNILLGDSKFANQAIKVKVFLERLNEGRESFINSFLLPEMRKIAQNLGFRTCPTPVFEKINLKDEAQFARVVTRMAELGILTPQQAFDTLESGLYPDKESMKEAQEKYKEERDNGLYSPLLGGSNRGQEKEGGRPSGTNGTPQSTKTITPAGSSLAEEQFSAKKIASVFQLASKLEEDVVSKLKKKHKVKKLSEEQSSIASSIAKSIIEGNKLENWNKALDEFIDNEKIMEDKEFFASAASLAAEKETDVYQASVMLNSKEIKD